MQRGRRAFGLCFQRSPFYLPLLIFIPSYCSLAIVVYLLELPDSPTLKDSFWRPIVTASAFLLGLIENSEREIQSLLIHKAQQEQNVRNIFDYMNQAKSIELNKPLFMPEDYYRGWQ